MATRGMKEAGLLVLVGLQLAGLGFAGVRIYRLAGVLRDVKAQAAIGATQATGSLVVADSLLAVVAARSDTIDRLRKSRDSLGRLLVVRSSRIPARPSTRTGPECLAWAARADSLAGVLDLARSTLTTSDSAVVTQEANLRDLGAAADTLRPAVQAARDVLEGVATPAPRPGPVGPARAALFGEATVGVEGPRVSAGLRYRSLLVVVEETRVGREVRVGARRELRLFR